MILRSVKKQFFLLATLICLTFIIAACGNDEKAVEKKEKANEPSNVNIALGHALDYLGLDPYANGRENTTLKTVVFESLALETSSGQFESALAENWEVSEDAKVWTFYLKKDIKFHDDTLFTSDAVVQAFNRYMQNKELSRRLGIEKVEATDDYTVVFTLTRPSATFLTVVGSYQTAIPSPTGFDAEGKFVEAIGTGPYKVQSSTKERIEFVANGNHWRGKPDIDNLNVIYISDASTMILALESGEVDLIGADGYGISFSEIERLKGNENLKVVINEDASSMEWIGFNLYKGPLSDKNLREALNYSINRQEIIDYVYEGYATTAKGPIGFNDSIPWVDTSIEGYTYDLAVAEGLFKKAGYTEKNEEGYFVKDGQALELTFVTKSDRTWKPVSEILQNQLKDVGVKVNLEVRGDDIVRDLVKKGEYDLVSLGSMGKSNADPYYFFQYYFTSTGTNSIISDSPKLDQLVRNVVMTIDHEKRAQIYNDIQQEVMMNIPGAFLVHPSRVTIMDNKYDNWKFAGTMDPLRFVYALTKK